MKAKQEQQNHAYITLISKCLYNIYRSNKKWAKKQRINWRKKLIIGQIKFTQSH